MALTSLYYDDELNFGQNLSFENDSSLNIFDLFCFINYDSKYKIKADPMILNSWPDKIKCKIEDEVKFVKTNKFEVQNVNDILNQNLDIIEKDQNVKNCDAEDKRKKLTEHGNVFKNFNSNRLKVFIEQVSDEATGKECLKSKSVHNCLEIDVLEGNKSSTNLVSTSFQHNILKCDNLNVHTSLPLYLIQLIMGIRSVIRLLFTYIPNGLSIHLSLSLILLFLINGISSQLQLSDEIENYPSISDIIDEDVLEILRAESVTRLEHDDAGQCIFVKSEGGTYSYTSPGGNSEVCGLYVISEPDQVVGFEFELFDITCTKGGLLSVIDGWELNGQFFPGSKDHLIPKSQRYNEFCGSSKPRKPFKASQNVGLIEFRIPIKGEGFKVKVKFHSNPKPCNAILQNPQGVFTLRNYGRKLNCSVSIMFPESFRILSTNIGIQERPGKILHSNIYFETGLVRKCKKRGLNDYVEIIGGDGLDTDVMKVADEFCGLDSIPSNKKIDIACGNTAIRMVSSGKYDNSVTIAFDLISHFATSTLMCSTFTDSQ